VGGTASGYNLRTMADYSCFHGVFGFDQCGPWVPRWQYVPAYGYQAFPPFWPFLDWLGMGR
jgi:hypothetical protein